MLVGLEKILTGLLGSASELGAESWLQAFTWVATVCVAFFAGISLRRTALQNRAALLLNLHRYYEDLENDRHQFSEFFETVRAAVRDAHCDLQEAQQTQQMRVQFSEQLAHLRRDRDPKFVQYTSYASFFELLGTYVRNGYLPLRDIVQLYKGPIIALDTVWRDYIGLWERETHRPTGLYENAIFLMNCVRTYTDHPIYYRTIYCVSKIPRQF
jgi:hypothetical protein